jgi:hypothetical protein
MLKPMLLATLLMLPVVVPAFAQTADTNSSAQQAAASCEEQMHRMAGLSKGLGANYNAERVRRDCAAGVYGR